MIYGAWIAVEERLPECGKPVLVKGHYTPPGYAYPTASLREPGDSATHFGPWASRESRGSMGITHWFEEVLTETGEIDTLKANSSTTH
jgi:hypothetical protein